MTKLPKTLALMRERNLKVKDIALQKDDKVLIDWELPPSEYERAIAQDATMHQVCIHHWS